MRRQVGLGLQRPLSLCVVCLWAPWLACLPPGAGAAARLTQKQSQASQEVQAAEAQALLGLMQALGSHPAFSHAAPDALPPTLAWGAPGAGPCAEARPWSWLSCSPEGRVTGIILDAPALAAVNASWVPALGTQDALTPQPLSGSLDLALLAPLQALEVLRLSGNNITGALSGVEFLTSLQDLWLDANHFSGSIPAAISSLAALRNLRLSSNDLHGNIPQELSALQGLESLGLAHNSLDGAFPPCLGSLGSLTFLDLSDNPLRSSLPAEWGKLSRLQQLQLRNTAVLGSVPEEWSTAAALQSLSCSNCSMEGPYPSVLTVLPNITDIQLANNSLSGPLPPALWRPPNLLTLDIAGNYLNGSLVVPSDSRVGANRFFVFSKGQNCFSLGQLGAQLSPQRPQSECSAVYGFPMLPSSAPAVLPPTAGAGDRGFPPSVPSFGLLGPAPPPRDSNSNAGGPEESGGPTSLAPPAPPPPARGPVVLQVGGRTGWTLPFTWSPPPLLVGDRLNFSLGSADSGASRAVQGAKAAAAATGAGAGTGGLKRDVWQLLSGVSFSNCDFSLAVRVGEAPVLTPKFLRPGTYYFASSPDAQQQCWSGMRLAVTVQKRSSSRESSSPPPPQNSSPSPSPNSAFSPPDAPSPSASAPPVFSPGPSDSSVSAGLILGLVLGLAACVLIALCLSVCLFCNRLFPEARARQKGPLPFPKGKGPKGAAAGQSPLLMSPAPSTPSLRDIEVHGAREFSYRELADATAGFSASRVLGSGSFGEVFYGELPRFARGKGAEVVAVKRQLRRDASGSGGLDASLLNEIRILSGAYHRNLVALKGYCAERGQLLLVYDFVPNGSLESLLMHSRRSNSSSSGGSSSSTSHGGSKLGRGTSAESSSSNSSGSGGSTRALLTIESEPSTACSNSNSNLACAALEAPAEEDPLTWERRLTLALGAAEGLNFLHNEALQPILHLDVKPANILVDSEFRAKVADFGLSKIDLEGLAAQDLQTTRIRGTPGYVDPECLRTCQLTDKSDVYSFGVVLLELATGWPPLEEVEGAVLHISARAVQGANKFGATSIAAPPIRAAFSRASCLDPSREPRGLAGAKAMKLFTRFLCLGAWCTVHDSQLRPTMLQVLQVLQELDEGITTPGAEHCICPNARFEESNFVFDCIDTLSWSLSTGTAQQVLPSFLDPQPPHGDQEHGISQCRGSSMR